MLLIIDNYDSFTYNLVQRIGEMDLGIEIVVHRNDDLSVADIRQLGPSHLIISPGPCTPDEAGISLEVAEAFAGELPLLGVCLGHQSIAQAFGAKIVRAPRLMHGKTDQIFHDGKGIFSDLPNPMVATRYHSLVIEPSTLSDEFEVSAWSELENGDREIMAIRHRTHPLLGVQFHPESFLTESGPTLLRHFVQLNS